LIELHVSEAAALAVVEQADYYQQASDVALAHRWEDAVVQIIHSLLKWPESGTLCRFRPAALRDLRWIPVPGFPRHMVFYRYLDREKEIRIVQVMHGARDLETLLDEDV
jgi:toxin ParE1/3/4